MKRIYTSVDIGTDTIKITVCELYQNKINLLAATSTKAMGIKKGLIADFELAKRSVSKAFREIEEMLGFKIKKVVALVPAHKSEYALIKSTLPIESEVTNVDVIEALNRALEANQNLDQELITALPVDYKVDDKTYDNPIGRKGNSLTVRAIKVAAPRKNVYSVCNLLEVLGIEVVDISVSGVSDMFAFKNKSLDDGISAIINIGADITNISLYNRGTIVKSSIINVGSYLVDKDIMYMYKVTEGDALKLKRLFALASNKHASTSDIYELKNRMGESVKINQFEISEVISSRMEEILNMVKDELGNLTSRQIDYIIVTGGISNIPDFDIVVNSVLGKNSKVGNIKVIGIRDNSYSSCIGSIVYFINKLKLKNEDFSMVSEEDSLVLSQNNMESNNHTDTMIGKVFGFFFNE